MSIETTPPTDDQVRARADELEKHLVDPYENATDMMALTFLVARIAARRAVANCEIKDGVLRDVVMLSVVTEGLDLVSRLMFEEAVGQLRRAR